MRRGLALLAALGLILSLPTAASAGKSTHATDTQVSIDCEGITTTGGTGFAFFNAFTSTSGDFDTDFAFWTSSEPVGDPAISRDFEAPVTVTWNGTTLSGSLGIVDSAGDPVGSASFSATLTPLGDPQPFTDSFKDGNHKFSATGTDQPMQPAGTLTTTTGLTFDLADCVGDLTVVTIFATNPASAVSHFAQRTSDCPLTSTAGDDGFVFIDFTDANDVLVDSGVLYPGGGGTGANGLGTIVGGTLDLSLDSYDFDTGEPLAVPASIHATFTETNDRFEVDMHGRANRRISSGTLVDIEGTMTIGTAVFDLSSCIGSNARTKDMFVPMQGPKAGGKVPTNDKPAGAIQLAVGKSATAMTKGASLDREAPYECLTFDDPEGPFEVPVSYTVWYKVTGTGGSITIDTTGSDFDTVVQVYTSGAGGFQFVPDGCDDDVPQVPFGRSLQAAVTIPTVAGTTYYVQIGGFPDTNFPYGNLKVAIR